MWRRLPLVKEEFISRENYLNAQWWEPGLNITLHFECFTCLSWEEVSFRDERWESIKIL